MTKLSPSLLLVVGALSLSGCGGGDDAFGRVPVEGVLTIDDKPVPYAMIQLEGKPNEMQQSAKATIHVMDGKFSVSADRGPSTGENSVVISMYDKAPTPATDPEEEPIEGNPLGSWGGTVVIEAGKPLEFKLKGDEVEK